MSDQAFFIQNITKKVITLNLSTTYCEIVSQEIPTPQLDLETLNKLENNINKNLIQLYYIKDIKDQNSIKLELINLFTNEFKNLFL